MDLPQKIIILYIFRNNFFFFTINQIENAVLYLIFMDLLKMLVVDQLDLKSQFHVESECVDEILVLELVYYEILELDLISV